MNFSLTKEQEFLKKLAAQFSENELEPIAEEVDDTHTFPLENFKKMALQELACQKNTAVLVVEVLKRRLLLKSLQRNV